jgi:hypothetical protein
MAAPTTPSMIGGPICYDTKGIGPGLLPGDGQVLTEDNRHFLWRIFVEIGKCWGNVRWNSSNLKSSWLEMIEAKSAEPPSYTAEYINAIYVVRELIAIYGEEIAFSRLFLSNNIPPGPPLTRLAHAKVFVVDEFITMQVMASGFKHFGGVNYAGYVKGSRYNLVPQVRAYTQALPGTEPEND